MSVKMGVSSKTHPTEMSVLLTVIHFVCLPDPTITFLSGPLTWKESDDELVGKSQKNAQLHMVNV